MIRRLATTIVMALACFGFCFGQDSTTSSRCLPFGDPMTSVVQICRGAAFDSVRQHFSPEAYVISGNTRVSLVSALRDKQRPEILNEDSTRRVVWMDIMGNDAGDAQYVIMKTAGAHDGNPHYHSLVLYKKPGVGWQIYLWHVGS